MGFRYAESGWTRQDVGGCGTWNRDADWANDTVVTALNNSMKNGLAFSHPGPGNPDIIGYAGPIDPEVGVIAAWDLNGALLGTVVNFACRRSSGPRSRPCRIRSGPVDEPGGVVEAVGVGAQQPGLDHARTRGAGEHGVG